MTKTLATSLEKQKMNLIISFTKEGNNLGDRILGNIGGNHLKSREYEGNIRDYIRDNWKNLDLIVFVSSTGIAVRYIKDYIVSKDVDPAVIVIDDMGKNTISLLSGHLGGGNEYTREIAKLIGSNPVITTATDNRDIEAVDVFSKKNSYVIDDIKSIKDISSLMIEGKKIGFYSELKEVIDYKNLRILNRLEDLEGLDGLIIVTNKLIDNIGLPHIILRPKNLVIGMGARKDVETERIIAAIEEELKRLNLSNKSIRSIGSVEAKKNEKGLIEGAKNYGLQLKIFTNEEISKVEDMFTKSQFVKDTIGVYNVSEPVAFLLGGQLLSRKERYNGITISVGEVKD